MYEIKSEEDFQKILKDNKNVLVDCYTTWCGPCKKFAPIFEELSKDFPNVFFCKVNIQEVDYIDNITAVPTFLFYKDGKNTDKVVGINVEELKKKIKDL